MNLKNKPFLLAPAYKDYLWGGRRLQTVFHKETDLSPLAESWECSTHPDGPSIVAGGRHQGMTLTQVLTEHPEYLGSHPSSLMGCVLPPRTDDHQIPPALQPQPEFNGLPVLVKLIDAAQNLSVQVHPDDNYAKIYENGSLGKTEMWYVLDAQPGAYLIYGFNRDMDEALLRRSLEQGTVEKYLQKVPVQKNDMFYIEAGTVHAIGPGILLAEIQESSNLTYRLYDYDRQDKSGRKRPLHIEKALRVLNYKSSEAPRQPIRVLRYRPGYASELLCRCRYFQVERLLINTSDKDAPDCSTTGHSFQVLLCVEGEGTLRTEEKCDSISAKTHPMEILSFEKGSCIFLPADSVPVTLHGRAQLLRISC